MVSNSLFIKKFSFLYEQIQVPQSVFHSLCFYIIARIRYKFFGFSRFCQLIYQNYLDIQKKVFLILISIILIMTFQSQNKQQYMTFHGELTNAMPVNQDEYISQFLVFESDEKPQEAIVAEEPVQPIHEQDPDHPDEIYEQSNPIDESSSVSHKAKRSPLHNFQKHFVTTIRRSVRLRWPQQAQDYMQLAKSMWQIFKNSRKYTKEFVSLILGQSQSNIDLELLKKYGLLECVSKFSESDYHRAQTYLKNKVLETFKSIPKQKIMYERRIGKKEQFANYFFKVLAQIQDGVMNKRLPKKKRGGRKNSFRKIRKQTDDLIIQENSFNS